MIVIVKDDKYFWIKVVRQMQNRNLFYNVHILSGSMLKMIAVVSMLIDHTAFVLEPVLPWMSVSLLVFQGKEITIYYLMRKIGRLAFPIYCFLISEGISHTKSKRNYSLRLFLFALISELPFNLMIAGNLFSPKQNVFFTLLLGTHLIQVFESKIDSFQKTFLMLILLAAARFLRADYGVSGAVLVLLLYLCRGQRTLQTVLSYPMLSGGVAAFAAFIPISMYNGKRGFIKTAAAKYAFYLFYPLHILFLLLIKSMLGNG